jgi:formylglycine-generating enzyme required for sulfatase activity
MIVHRGLKVFAAFLACSVLFGCESAPEGMVLVPAGEFTMGTSAEDKDNHALSLGLLKPWFADESPEHRPYSKSFYIDKYEVTNREYYIFTQANDHRTPRHWGGPRYPDDRGDYPVTNVTFYDAAAYAEWKGKRLPTEQEWEKAARGELGSLYPWGNKFVADAANISHSSKAKGSLQPVGSFPQGASPYGAEDMIGNAWEWVWDYYYPYQHSTYDNPDYGRKYIIVRGLSYMGVGHFPKKEYSKVVALKARAAYREKMHPMARKKDVVFRCVLERKALFEKWFGHLDES